jgi:hypothetical protein
VVFAKSPALILSAVSASPQPGTWCGVRSPTHLFGHFTLERPILLDLLALLFSCGLTLVDHAGDAGNAVLGNCQPHSHAQLSALLTLAMEMCYDRSQFPENDRSKVMLVLGWRAKVKGGGRGVAHLMTSSGYLHFTSSRWSDVTLLSTVRRVACYCIQSTEQYKLMLYARLNGPEACNRSLRLPI